jgi:hypothetical protein
MSSLWDSVFIQVLDRTDPLMLNLNGTPDIMSAGPETQMQELAHSDHQSFQFFSSLLYVRILEKRLAFSEVIAT